VAVAVAGERGGVGRRLRGLSSIVLQPPKKLHLHRSRTTPQGQNRYLLLLTVVTPQGNKQYLCGVIFKRHNFEVFCLHVFLYAGSLCWPRRSDSGELKVVQGLEMRINLVTYNGWSGIHVCPPGPLNSILYMTTGHHFVHEHAVKQHAKSYTHTCPCTQTYLYT
jgi:hypothetical protein